MIGALGGTSHNSGLGTREREDGAGKMAKEVWEWAEVEGVAGTAGVADCLVDSCFLYWQLKS